MELDVPSEIDLLAAAKKFDGQALAQVYDLYSPGIYRYAMRLLGDPLQAEDCVSETFSRFLLALRDGRGPREYLRAYLYRIAHNWITDQYRRNATPPEELDEEMKDKAPGTEELAGESIRRRQLQTALSRLTPEQRQVLILKFLEGWENEEIARALHKPVGAVKSLQHRGLVRLQKLLDQEESA